MLNSGLRLTEAGVLRLRASTRSEKGQKRTWQTKLGSRLQTCKRSYLREKLTNKKHLMQFTFEKHENKKNNFYT